MTKFDIYVENLVQAKEERRNEEWNRRLCIGLEAKTHEEAVEALFSGLTVILGVRDLQTEKVKTLA